MKLMNYVLIKDSIFFGFETKENTKKREDPNQEINEKNKTIFADDT